MPIGQPVIAHLDLDAFYAQVEMVRLGVDRDTPLCVQQWQGIIAVNYPARKYGISRHDTVHDVKIKCPQCILVHVQLVGADEEEESACVQTAYRPLQGNALNKVRFTSKVSLERYRAASARIFNVITRTVPLTERGSIDEAYLDITELVTKRMRKMGNSPREEVAPRESAQVIVGDHVDTNLPDDLALLHGAEIVNQLRFDILSELHYTCSVGIAHNKTLAKLASSMNKPNGQTIIPSSAVPRLMDTLPLKKIRFLGGKLGSAIAELGVETAGDAQRFSVQELEKRVGAKSAQFVHDIVRGIDTTEVNPRSRSKSMLAAKQMAPESTWEGVERWMRVLAGEMQERLELDEELNNREARGLAVSFKSQASSKSASKRLPMPRDKSARRILTEVMDTLRATRTFSLPVTFLGLTATNFDDKVSASNSIQQFLKSGAASAPLSRLSEGGGKRVATKVVARDHGGSATAVGSRDGVSGALDSFFPRKSADHQATDGGSDSSPAAGKVDTVTSDYELALRLQSEEKRLAEHHTEMLSKQQRPFPSTKRRKTNAMDLFLARGKS